MLIQYYIIMYLFYSCNFRFSCSLYPC